MEKWTEKYLNTLWFTTVSKAITVIIFMLLAFPFSKPFLPLLLTIQTGLVIIIVWALLRMFYVKNNLNKQYRTMQETIMTNPSCPDYFTRGSNDKAETMCYNKYVTPDSRKIYYFMDPMTSTSKRTIDMNTAINVDALFRDKLQNVCNGPITSDPMYRKFPWTELKSLCDDDLDEAYVVKSEEDEEDEQQFNFELKLPKEFYREL